MSSDHESRERAESFGSNAERYDSTRPSYPPALIEWLSRDGVGRAVDVGCGTGRVARLLLDAGWTVIGVEPDARMATVARRHGVDVDVSTFESWVRLDSEFDLVSSGQAWHWVDPESGLANAGRLLRSGGRLALFWNGYSYDRAVSDVMTAVFDRHAPELVADSILLGNNDFTHMRLHEEAIEEFGHDFGPVETVVFAHERRRTVEQWVEEARTISSIALLAPTIADALFAELGERLRSVTGGNFVVRHPTRILTAVRS